MIGRSTIGIDVALAGLLGLWASAASGQIVYEPVRFQYGCCNSFYYGGSDPAAIAFGCAQPSAGPAAVTVYSDARPMENVAIYGTTISQVRDEAYGNVPRFFRKRDLLAAGSRLSDDTLVIGAQTVPIAEDAKGPAEKSPNGVIVIVPHGGVVPAVRSDKVLISLNSREGRPWVLCPSLTEGR